MPQADRRPTTLIPTARRVPPTAPAVTEHTPPRRAPRRRFLMEAGATLALSLGATAAVLAPDPVWGAPATDAGPDAALIAACDRYIRAVQTYDADPSDIDMDVDPLWHEVEAAREAAEDIPARTFSGLVAKAQVAVHLGTMLDGSVNLSESYALSWPGDVVRDVLGVAGIEVPA